MGHTKVSRADKDKYQQFSISPGKGAVIVLVGTWVPLPGETVDMRDVMAGVNGGHWMSRITSSYVGYALIAGAWFRVTAKLEPIGDPIPSPVPDDVMEEYRVMLREKRRVATRGV